MIKFLGLGLAASLLFTPTTSLIVANSTSTQNSSVSDVSSEVYSSSRYTYNNNIFEGPETKVLIRDGVEAQKNSLFSETYKIVPVHHDGGAFNDAFTSTPSDGVNLNIWMRNNSSYAVQFQVKINGLLITDQTIAAGAQKTISYTDMFGVGLNGSYSIYIYSRLGYSLDVDVSARQF
ncbi:hypothetical protein [Paenibacillus ihuae]|uniref:hypothetical protein n=1 Tax=Paenibacillus ihuae TaxID=1232431 RepID=UPI0006D5A541|nr:hypothetical protein [Paenibacillus ihuae]